MGSDVERTLQRARHFALGASIAAGGWGFAPGVT